MTMFGSPPIPDWLQQAPSDASMPPVNVAPSLMQTPQIKMKRGGMFGSGLNAGEIIVNLLNGALAGAGNPVGIANIKMMQDAYREKQRQAQEDAEYQRKRQDTLVDYEAKQKIDQRYPTAPQPTEYERMLQAAGIMPGTPEYIQHVKSYVDMKENPPYYFTDPTTGRLMSMPRNGGGMGAPASPGVTFTPIEEGGPSLGGSGGFL